MKKQKNFLSGAVTVAAIVLLAAANAMAVNSTAALKDAIAAANADNTPTTILIMGNFLITETITIPANKNITIKSDGATAYTITRGFNGTNALTTPIFLIQGKGTLTIENIIIDGAKETYSSNIGPLVRVVTSATFNMNAETVLQNNYNETMASAVLVNKDSIFNMTGGKITGNEPTVAVSVYGM